MKKKITAGMIVILWMTAFSLKADIRIGVKTGVNLGKASFNKDAINPDNLTGFKIGPVVEFSVPGGLGIDASILYSRHGIKISKAPAVKEYDEKVVSLDIPVNMKLKFSVLNLVGCYLSGGPYISFELDDRISLDKIREQWKSKRFGAGLNFGGGVELITHLQVGINYQLALNDDYGNFISNWTTDFQNLKAKTRIWSLTAIYFF